MMSHNADPPPTDLPPRTWRGWWFSWPKWFRIGCWAGLGVLMLHVALVVRICVGLIEPKEIQALRQSGATIALRSDFRREPFEGFNLIMDGLNGRSCEDVVEIRFHSDMTKDDLQLVRDFFPNLQLLDARWSEISNESLGRVCQCQKLRDVDLSHTNLDDAGGVLLSQLTNLRHLDISGSLIGDKTCLSVIKIPKLETLDITNTNVRLRAAQRAFTQRSSRRLYVHRNSDDTYNGVFSSIRWADGGRSVDFAGPQECRLKHESKRETISAEMSNSTFRNRARLFWYPRRTLDGPDGKYRFQLRLADYVSEPIDITVKYGAVSAHYIEFRMPCTKAEALESVKAQEETE